MNRSPSLKLPHYFWIDAINACCVTLFLYCVYFWTKAKYGYTDIENLLLTSTHGFIYIFMTKYGGKLSDRLGYDRLLSICAFGSACTLLCGWILPWRGAPFLVVILYTLFHAPMWPTLEAAVLYCPASTSMPDRLGLYNITWAFFDGIGFFISAILFKWDVNSIVWVPGFFHLFQWAWLRWAPKNTRSHGEPAMQMPHSGDEVPRATKRQFMYMAWIANALAYLMIAGFSTLTPQMGERLHLSPELTIWLACTLLFARAFAFIIFWKWEGWHYHKGLLQWALWIAPICLACVFFANHGFLVIVALTVFGLAVGLSYSGSLYYSLDYGENKGEHGGMHEAILGLGIFFGPLLGAIVSWLGGGTVGAQWTFVILALVCNGIGLIAVGFLNQRSVISKK